MKNRIIIITDAGLDDSIALQYLFTHEKIQRFMSQPDHSIDIRCVSGNVQAAQVYENVKNTLATVFDKPLPNLYITCQPADYDADIEAWVEGYGQDGVCGLFESTDQTTYPSLEHPMEIKSENLYILALSPFSLANELVRTYADRVRLVVSMGGHDASYSGDDMEFNQSLDPSSFDALKQICIEREIPHSNITYEECLNYNDLLISVPESVSDFYTRFRYYCDAYTAQMQKLDMPTTCYDLIAALKFADELTE